ncbi:MAG: type II toxin-antitoxin system VapC family toxin [Deltaproteobacteria bacterium]|nr:type II toxin-antitoxin system VapC family toxin [Deltaproteobacteria bacterium]
MKFLLDTNICIYIIKRKPPQVLKKFKTFKINDLGISSITLAELEFGVHLSNYPEKNQEALNEFLSPLEIIPFDDRAAVTYGEIRAFLQQKGLRIGAMDMLIAAQAKSLSIPLVTNNLKEFKRIPGLRLENWV